MQWHCGRDIQRIGARNSSLATDIGTGAAASAACLRHQHWPQQRQLERNRADLRDDRVGAAAVVGRLVLVRKQRGVALHAAVGALQQSGQRQTRARDALSAAVGSAREGCSKRMGGVALYMRRQKIGVV